VRRWAARVCRDRPEVLRLGYFGSYARGDWGVGSDLDLVVIVKDSDQPFEGRARDWDTLELPVPVDDGQAPKPSGCLLSAPAAVNFVGMGVTMEIPKLVREMAQEAKQAARPLGNLTRGVKDQVLLRLAELLQERRAEIQAPRPSLTG